MAGSCVVQQLLLLLSPATAVYPKVLYLVQQYREPARSNKDRQSNRPASCVFLCTPSQPTVVTLPGDSLPLEHQYHGRQSNH